jgi:hypothetical protein
MTLVTPPLSTGRPTAAELPQARSVADGGSP